MAQGCTSPRPTLGFLRLFIRSCFDTVYVSLSKYFNAPFGAILAGSGPLIESATLLRHQFGGGLLHAWESAAVALHYLDGFEERYAKAVLSGEELFQRLQERKFRVRRIQAGTNVFQLDFPSPPDAGLQARLAARGVFISPPPAHGPTEIQINETILRRTPGELTEELVNASS